MKNDKEYNYTIIISSRVKERIIHSEDSDIPLFIENDVFKKTIGLVRENAGRGLLILYFLPMNDVEELCELLKDFKGKDILFKIAAISEGVVLEPRFPYFSFIFEFRTSNISKLEFAFLVESGFSVLRDIALQEKEREENMITLLDTRNDQESLINIGRALSMEKNQDALLRKILYLSKKITGADAGSIFIVVENEESRKRLSFKYSNTFSKELSYEEFTIPYDKSSIAGYVAVTGKVLNISDVYKLDELTPVCFNRSFDLANDYRTKSMLVVPMRNHLDQIIGVIQLINSKKFQKEYTGNEAYEVLLKAPEDFDKIVIPFEQRYENLMEAVAGQAAIALENRRMIKQIQNQFEEFVKASVTAIESRDPATSGHSFRVAKLCVNLAKAVNRQKQGVFADVCFLDSQFKELELAALLHDFGKVYIETSIFIKGKKLYPMDFKYLNLRLDYLYRSLELKYSCIQKSVYMEQLKGIKQKARVMEQEKDKHLNNLKNIKALIAELNEPTVMTEDSDILIKRIQDMKDGLECMDFEGKVIPVLSNYEADNLRIKRGSLNKKERKIIKSHVEHSYNFVSKIPWPPEFSNIPEIILKHHEKIDGSGYPLKLKGKESIPIQARIMTIADIFDALTAGDRPYKKAVSFERVLEILNEEASAGSLDHDLVRLFIEDQVYEHKRKV